MADVSALLEDSAEDLYENAPCGYLSTLMDGTVVKINRTLLNWLGYTRAEVIGRLRFPDLLTVGGKLYHETHFAPLLRMQGELNGIALEIRTVNGSRLPVLVTSVVKTAGDGRQLLVRTTVFDARDRRAYESELLRARHEAEEARRIAERDRERLKSVLGTLQRSLLPPSLPKVPGLEAVAAYHAASQDDLGGDFYDLFALGGERWCFFLGDVCGKGPEAAAVTSLTRYTLRAAALHAPEPISMLGTLNTALQERYTGDSSRYCTVIVGILAAERDGFTVTLAGGGHPPALLLCADGRACYVPTTGGHARRAAAVAVVRRRRGPAGTRRHPPALHRRDHRGPHLLRRRTLRRRGAAGLRRQAGPHVGRRHDRGGHPPARELRRGRRRRHRPARARRPTRLSPYRP